MRLGHIIIINLGALNDNVANLCLFNSTRF